MGLDLLVGVALWGIVTILFLKSGLEALGHFSRRDDPDGQHGAALMLGLIYTGIGLAGMIFPIVVWLN